MDALAPSEITFLDRVRQLTPLIRQHDDEMEKIRRMPVELVEAFQQAGLFKMWMPPALGGAQIDLVSYYDVIEAVASVSGAAGWNLMLNSSLGFFSSGVPQWSGEELFSAPGAIVAGQINLTSGGRAVAVAGGYKVTGRWAFASGVQQSTCVLSAVTIYDGDEARCDGNGAPMHRYIFMPSKEITIHDTWYTLGLCGTGSNHYSCEDVFVPEERLFLRSDKGFYDSPLYRCKEAFHYCIAIPLLGMARGALEDFKDIATNRPTRTNALLKDSEFVQVELAWAEVRLTAARNQLWHISEEIFATAAKGDEITPVQINQATMATVYAGETATSVVDAVFNACGGTAVYKSHPLERRFRDIHTARQHAGLSRPWLMRAGQNLFKNP